MKRSFWKSLCLGSMAVLLSFLTACSHVNENYEKTYPELITHFANCGIKVDSVTPLAYYLAQAESGYAFKIGPREIGIYKYNQEPPRRGFRGAVYQWKKIQGSVERLLCHDRFRHTSGTEENRGSI